MDNGLLVTGTVLQKSGGDESHESQLTKTPFANLCKVCPPLSH